MSAACIAGVFAGAVIMVYNIWFYYRSLVSLRQESYAQKTFSEWTYGLCMVLMCFFLAGYLGMGLVYLFRREVGFADLLVALVFFFGAVFVLVVLKVQSQINHAVREKGDEIIKTLVNTMEAKDAYTRGHSVHVANLVKQFYRSLPLPVRQKVNYAQLMDAAILHDIGKIGIPDNVLNKPGRLDEEEWALIRTHPRMGKEILAHTSFSCLGDIIMMHHERMDQKGYYRVPQDQIPLESRMIAIADVFSAVYTDRVYRPRKSYAEAMRILQDAAGTQLDKELVRVFAAIPEEKILECTRGLYVMEQSDVLQRPWAPPVRA